MKDKKQKTMKSEIKNGNLFDMGLQTQQRLSSHVLIQKEAEKPLSRECDEINENRSIRKMWNVYEFLYVFFGQLNKSNLHSYLRILSPVEIRWRKLQLAKLSSLNATATQFCQSITFVKSAARCERKDTKVKIVVKKVLFHDFFLPWIRNLLDTKPDVVIFRHTAPKPDYWPTGPDFDVFLVRPSFDYSNYFWCRKFSWSISADVDLILGTVKSW